MTTAALISFLLLAMVIIAIPGPNILVIITTSLNAGTRRGLQTVAGTSTAMLIQLTVAALGTSWFLALVSEGLLLIKWLGVAYLIYLGVSALRSLQERQDPVPAVVLQQCFQRGFWVSLANPKTLLFFTAFLPQFVQPGAPYLPQLVLLSGLFWVLAVCIDSGYALLAGSLRRLVASRDAHRIEKGLSGTLYLLAGGLLATSHKSSV